MKIIKPLVIGLVALISSCSTLPKPVPHGHADFAFVPSYGQIFDYKENISKLEVGFSLEQKLYNNVSLEIGGAARTYMELPKNNIYFDPFSQGYDIFAELKLSNFTLYAFHNCTHPVKAEEQYFQGAFIEDRIFTSEQFTGIANAKSITEIGLKYEF